MTRKAPAGMRLLLGVLLSGLTVAEAGAIEGGAKRPLSMAVEDLDGDGVQDLVCGFQGSDGGEVVIYRGRVSAVYPKAPEERNADRTSPFEAAGSFPLPRTPSFLAVSDVNGDGRADLIVATLGASSLDVLRGGEFPRFVHSRSLELP